ncbi:hypothetical protein TWF481_012207 [Arthrobotrys musiformis]|uniref:Uncharacterized protein n=1 Tax=Arthrobotrys musiformis TaxID=47236 RepID=A0AAV9VY74_9PEZI
MGGPMGGLQFGVFGESGTRPYEASLAGSPHGGNSPPSTDNEDDDGNDDDDEKKDDVEVVNVRKKSQMEAGKKEAEDRKVPALRSQGLFACLFAQNRPSGIWRMTRNVLSSFQGTGASRRPKVLAYARSAEELNLMSPRRTMSVERVLTGTGWRWRCIPGVFDAISSRY